MTRKNCIFHQECDECNDVIKDEHIIQRALGGSLSSKKIICAACNNYFSNTLDRKLTGLYAPIMDVLAPLLPGRLKTRTRRVKSLGGSQIKFVSSGGATVDGVQKKYDEKGRLKEILAPESYSRQQLEAIAKKLGCNIQNTSFSATLLGDRPTEGYYQSCVKVDHLAIVRAVSLDILELVRYATVELDFPAIAAHTSLRGLRNLIRNGMWSPSCRLTYCYCASIADLVEPLFKASVFSHKMVVSYDRRARSLIIAAQFVDTMPWLIVLEGLNIHSQSISLLHKKALVEGDDQLFVAQKAVLTTRSIQWRTFSRATSYADSFARIKFLQSYCEQYGRAVYHCDMRDSKEISRTLCNRIVKYRKKETCPQVGAITQVIGIRYCWSPHLGNIKEKLHELALSLWNSDQFQDRTESERTLEIYRLCLQRVVSEYGMPKTLGDLE